MVYRPPPLFWWLKLTVSTVQPPPSIRSKLHPKHRHRHHRHRRLRHVLGGRRHGRSGLHWWIWGRRCSRLRWIVGIRLGDTGGGLGRLVGAAKIGRFSDFRVLLGTFWRRFFFWSFVTWARYSGTDGDCFYFWGGNVYTKNKCVASAYFQKDTQKNQTKDLPWTMLE